MGNQRTQGQPWSPAVSPVLRAPVQWQLSSMRAPGLLVCSRVSLLLTEPRYRPTARKAVPGASQVGGLQGSSAREGRQRAEEAGGSGGGDGAATRALSAGPPGLFFTAGGRRDHIKIFITDLQKMRELHITLTCLASGFLLLQDSSRKDKGRRLMSQAVGSDQRAPRRQRPCSCGWPQALSGFLGEPPRALEGGDKKRWVGRRHPQSHSSTTPLSTGGCLQAGLQSTLPGEQTGEGG